MKKEVITVKDGKQFKEEIGKILKQAKGKDLYIDEELVEELKDSGDFVDDMMMFSNNNVRYSGIASKTNLGFYKVHSVSEVRNGKIYSNPLMPEKLVLIILA